MDLFQELNKIMAVNTDTTIVVRKLSDEKMTVSVNFRNDAVKDDAKNLLQPFIVSGSPVELDEGFVPEISKPLAESAGLQSKMLEFEAAKKVAEAKSAALAEQKKKEAEEKKKRKESYNKLLDVAKTAQNEQRWRDAIKALNDAMEFAEESEKAKIKEGIAYCESRDVPSLFDFGEPAPKAPDLTPAPIAEAEESTEEEQEEDDLPD